MSTIRISDIPKLLLEDRQHLLGVLHYQMALTLPKAAAVVLNSFEELDSVVTHDLKSKLQTKVLSIGPSPLYDSLNKPPAPTSKSSDECILWLNMHKAASVAYISFGTLMKCPPHELVACAQALEATGVPFLWSLPASEWHILPEAFIERTSGSNIGKMVSWAPQLQVLEHSSVGAHVTHCGWNSMLESITGGVPLIGRPFLGEHFLTIRLVEEVWRFGVKLEGGVFTKRGMMNALDLVLLSEKGKELRNNIGVLREQAIKALGSNGSSTLNFKTLKEVVTSVKRT